VSLTQLIETMHSICKVEVRTPHKQNHVAGKEKKRLNNHITCKECIGANIVMPTI